jgi:hypothetical protein
MSAVLDWSLYELEPLIELLGKVIMEHEEILRYVERAGCEDLGNIPQPKPWTAKRQWEEVVRFAINNRFLEQLIQQVQPSLQGNVRDDFRRNLQMAGARRIVRLLGPDYSELRNDFSMLLEEEDPNRQLEAATAIRRIALRLRKELDDDLSWQAFTPIGTSTAEIQQTRERLVLICLNIVSASDYMLAIIRPLCAIETASDSKVERMYLTAHRKSENNSSSDDEQLRHVMDARMTLAIEARRLWRSIKESVTLAPTSNPVMPD